ncbi:hypothetical protein ACL02T_30150 [Pseudonocardia sp. RS010]|uniref:hypothetical protein n=1 Tax=Pseudonocardia sp. RS010 TaxID=3385979 RepID=UPI0039A3ECAE
MVGDVALAALGFRRYGLRRPPVLGPTSRTVATGVTIFTGYPFLRGALRSLTGRRGAGTDAPVSAATVASLVLRENVVALTVLWLLNIGEYLQDLTLRRSRRAISDLLTGAQTRTWMRLADGTELEVDIDDVRLGGRPVPGGRGDPAQHLVGRGGGQQLEAHPLPPVALTGNAGETTVFVPAQAGGLRRQGRQR